MSQTDNAPSGEECEPLESPVIVSFPEEFRRARVDSNGASPVKGESIRLTDEDERLLADVWKEIAAMPRTSRVPRLVVPRGADTATTTADSAAVPQGGGVGGGVGGKQGKSGSVPSQS